MSKIPWGNEAIPRGESMPEPNRGGHSIFSTGPTINATPEDNSSFHIPMLDMMPSTLTGITDGMTRSPLPSEYGPPYETSSSEATDESDFKRLEHKLAHEKGVNNPAGLAAKIGREELGQAEMTRRSVAGRKHHED